MASTSGTTTVTTPTDRSIRTERIVDASQNRVWKAFTDPELIAQWWGRGNRVDVERMEVERGGGMLNSGIEEDLSQSYAALDELLVSPR